MVGFDIMDGCFLVKKYIHVYIFNSNTKIIKKKLKNHYLNIISSKTRF
jgi:hypothetical protein